MLSEAVLRRIRTRQEEALRNRQEAKAQKTLLRQAVRRLMTSSRTPIATKRSTKSTDPVIEVVARIEKNTQAQPNESVANSHSKQVTSSNEPPNTSTVIEPPATPTSNVELPISPLASSSSHSKKRSLKDLETPIKSIVDTSTVQALCPENPSSCTCSVQNRMYVKKLKWKRLQLLMQKLPLDRLIACYLSHMYQSTGWKNLKKKAQACGLEISKCLTAINPQQNTFDLHVYPLPKDNPNALHDWLEERYIPIQNGTFHELLLPGYLTRPTCGSLEIMKQLQKEMDHEFTLYQKKLVFYQNTIQKEIQMISKLLALELNLANTTGGLMVMINEYGLRIDPQQQIQSILDEENQRAFLIYLA